MKINFGKITYIGETPLEFGKGLRIEYDEAPPVSLFKYYSPSNHNFLSVSKGEFYASHPYQFNDLTDSNPLSYDFTNLSFDNFKKLYEPVVKIGRLKNEDVKNMFDIDAANGFKEYRIHFYSMLTQKIGVICLSTNEMHNLMWGYYASDSGFKIKFKTQKLIESINTSMAQNCLFFPINYVENKLHIDVNAFGSHIPILIDVSTKVLHWQHENEWRIVAFKNDMSVPNSYITPHVENHIGVDNRLVNYDKDSIEEIVFGINFFNGNIIEKITSKSITENIVEIKNEAAIEFLKFVSNNLKGKTFMSGLFINPENTSYAGTTNIERSIEEIIISHIDKNIFSILRKKPGHLKSFPNKYD